MNHIHSYPIILSKLVASQKVLGASQRLSHVMTPVVTRQLAYLPLGRTNPWLPWLGWSTICNG